MAWIRAGSTSCTQPPTLEIVSGIGAPKKGTTTDPVTSAAPEWICAAVTEVCPSQCRRWQTVSLDGFRVMTARAVAVGSAGGISRLPVIWPTNTLPLPEPFPPLEKTGPATATVAARASPATPEMIPIVFLLRMKPPFDPPARALDLHRE